MNNVFICNNGGRMEVDVESIRGKVIPSIDGVLGYFSSLEQKIGSIKIPSDFTRAGAIKRILDLVQVSHDNVSSSRVSIAIFVNNILGAEAANMRIITRHRFFGRCASR